MTTLHSNPQKVEAEFGGAHIPSIQEATMSSLTISELIGKPHNDLLKSIRSMETAWHNVTGGNFSLSQYRDASGKSNPCYNLTKTECLYVATKFNDEARARLVVRWEELERAAQPQVPQTFAQALLLAARQQEQIEQQQKQLTQQSGQIAQLSETVTTMERRVSYLDRILDCKSTVLVKVIAQDYGMSAIAFNQLLHQLGIQYRQGDVWVLYVKYIREGYVKDVPFEYTQANGTRGVVSHTQWTQKGREFLYHFLKDKGYLPLIEQ